MCMCLFYFLFLHRWKTQQTQQVRQRYDQWAWSGKLTNLGCDKAPGASHLWEISARQGPSSLHCVTCLTVTFSRWKQMKKFFPARFKVQASLFPNRQELLFDLSLALFQLSVIEATFCSWAPRVWQLVGHEAGQPRIRGAHRGLQLLKSLSQNVHSGQRTLQRFLCKRKGVNTFADMQNLGFSQKSANRLRERFFSLTIQPF